MLPSSFLAARSFPKGHRTKKIDLQTSLRAVTKYLALKITSKSRGCIVLLYIVFSSFTTKVNISTTISQRIAQSPAVCLQLHKRHSGVTRRSIICIWAFVWEKKKRGGKKPFQLIKIFYTRGFSVLNTVQMYFRTDSAITKKQKIWSESKDCTSGNCSHSRMKVGLAAALKYRQELNHRGYW